MSETKPQPSPPDENIHHQGERATAAYNEVNWNLLVSQVKQRDDVATEQLRRLFSRGIRYYLRRQLGTQDLDNRVRDTFLMLCQAIQRGEVREPERLTNFVRTVLSRQVINYIDRMARGLHLHAVGDTKQHPEQEVMLLQKSELMQRAMQKLPARDREILLRFYVREQSQEQVCREMQMTETEFRSDKSDAKAKFGDMVNKLNSE